MTTKVFSTECLNPDFNSERISKTATIEIKGEIENVFPLFGPVREKDWAPGWEPVIIYPQHVLVEEHMLFKTNAKFSEEKEYLWCITHFSPEKYQIEYSVSTPERIWFIRVACEANGAITKATISNTFTGLSERGNELNQIALEKMYVQNLKDWEKEINYYLEHGKRIDQ